MTPSYRFLQQEEADEEYTASRRTFFFVEFGRFDKAVDHARRFGSFSISKKQSVLSPHNKRPYGYPGHFIVRSNFVMLKKAYKSSPLVEVIFIAHSLRPFFENRQVTSS